MACRHETVALPHRQGHLESRRDDREKDGSQSAQDRRRFLADRRSRRTRSLATRLALARNATAARPEMGELGTKLETRFRGWQSGASLSRSRARIPVGNDRQESPET